MHLDICLNFIFVTFNHRLTLSFVVVFLYHINNTVTTSYYNATTINHRDIIHKLKYLTNANVYVKGSHLYDTKRRIHNGLCDNLFPDVIVEPKSTYDVSEIIKIARNVNVPISVRSGGHSYICGSIRNSKYL